MSEKVPDALREKFPELRPVKRAPVLTTVNGIGLSMFGKRDADSETGTYVKTHCLCFIYIPLFALGAYRVADGPNRSWYFLGKTRLSSLARNWNLGLLAVCVIVAALLTEHSLTSSPEFQARRDLSKAAEVLAAGKPLEAATIYGRVAQGSASADLGRKGLRESMARCITNDSPEQVAGAFHLLASLPKRVSMPEPVLPNAYEHGLALVDKFRANNPEGALDILQQVAPLATPTNASVKPLQVEMLKEII